MNNFDDLKLATEAMTGGKNTVLLDDVGMPSIMVVIPKMNSKDLITGATDETHPGFIVGGVEKDKVYVSKYLNIVQNNRAYSLPMQDPRVSVSFDSALNYCRNKGEGWGLTPASLWAAIALWCGKNATIPHGNNNYGSDIGYAHEKGVVTSIGSDDKINRIATGSGPVSWYHDYTNAGICDLNGNVWEWIAGLRIKAGEIQLIPYANSMQANCDMGATSSAWKVIDSNGNFSGNGESVKLDCVEDKWSYITSTPTNKADSSRGCAFSAVSSNLSNSVKTQLIKYGLLPDTSISDYGSDVFGVNNYQNECLPYRGGSWTYGNSAGIYSLILSYARTYVATMVGFRSVYYEL